MSEELNFKGTWVTRNGTRVEINRVMLVSEITQELDAYKNMNKFLIGKFSETGLLGIYHSSTGICLSHGQDFDLNERVRPALLTYA